MNFSIIVPVFNGEHQIPQTLNSLVQISKNVNIEVIVIDDCSQDRTTNLVREFSDSLDLELVRNPKNLGAAISRNIGVEHARYETIVFNDCDDESFACRFDVHQEHFQVGANLSFVSSIKNYYTRELRFELDNQVNISLSPDEFTRYILLGDKVKNHPKLHLPAASMAINRDFFNDIGGFDSRYSRNEDVDLLIRSFEKKARLSTSSIFGVYRNSGFNPHQSGYSNLKGELCLLQIHGPKYLTSREIYASRSWFFARADYFEKRYVSSIKNLTVSALYRPSRVFRSILNRIPKRLHHDLRNGRK